MAESLERFTRRWHRSRLAIVLLAVNATCFGGCIVLLALGAANGPSVLLTVGTGLMTGSGVAGFIYASRRANVA